MTDRNNDPDLSYDPIFFPEEPEPGLQERIAATDLLNTTNPRVWAIQFMERHGQNLQEVTADTLASWFSYAMTAQETSQLHSTGMSKLIAQALREEYIRGGHVAFSLIYDYDPKRMMYRLKLPSNLAQSEMDRVRQVWSNRFTKNGETN